MNKALAAIKLQKLVILIICFGVTSIFVYLKPSSRVVSKQTPVNQALEDIDGWTFKGFLPLEPRIIKALELDDYANNIYSNGNDMVSLYIGYYYTAKKIGAAHDPLVCFPGQGWVVSNRKKGEIILNSDESQSIRYSKMTAQRGQQKELIVYWFQSYNQTSSHTFSQKITAFWKKLLRQVEENAFVRISTPLGERSSSECLETIFKFVQSFYPVFLDYIENKNLMNKA